MEEFKRRPSFKRIFYAPVTIVVMAVLLFFIGRALLNVYASAARSSEDLSAAQHNLADLQARSDYLSTEIDQLNSPRGMEEALRDKYPVAKEGEKMVIIVQPTSEASTTGGAEEGFWQRVMDFFK